LWKSRGAEFLTEPIVKYRRFQSTARFAATSAILTDTSSRSGRAPISSTVKRSARVGCRLCASASRFCQSLPRWPRPCAFWRKS
jgi:hypothetical protein